MPRNANTRFPLAELVTLRSFFGWAVEAGLLAANPLRGVTMRPPKTLPHVPEDQDVRRLLSACSDATFEERRNRALLSLLGDGGLRISWALRLGGACQADLLQFIRYAS